MIREAGFTLLEVLVALVVLGLIVAGLGQGLRFGLDASARQERMALEHGDLDALDRLLRRLVEQMDPGTERDPVTLVGTATTAAFTTDLGVAARALATTRAEVRLAVDGNRLVMRWQPAVQGVRLVAPPPPDQVTLLEGVERIEFGYWGPAGEAPPAWRSSWDGKALPLLLRVHLAFSSGSGRRWPDIVAGPAQPQARP